MPADASQAILQKLLLSAAAASVAETATFPLDLLKTRLQLAGQQAAAQGAAAPPANLLATARVIIQLEGVGGLYAGLAPAVLRHVPYTGIRVLAFEQLRSLAQQRWAPAEAAAAASQAGEARIQQLPLPVRLAIGLTAGGVAQFVAVPADLIKVRMQADGRLVAAGLQPAPRYKGVVHAFSSVLAQEGMRGLWRGSLPAVQRAALVNLGELTTYDAAKQQVLRSGVTGGDNVWAHALSSTCSGFVASVVSTPADVVKTRLMNQDPARPAYRGMLHCFTATLRAEGVRGLYAGFIPTWSRLAPWQLCFWIGQLTNLVTLELAGRGEMGLIDCPGALVAGISALGSTLQHLELSEAPVCDDWLPDSVRHLSALRALRIAIGSWGGDHGRQAGQQLFNSALQQLPQLTGLLLQGETPGPPPPAIASMSQLQWLHLGYPSWDEGVLLPAGPYQSSLRRLIGQFYMIAASLPVLRAMPRLEQISLTEPPSRDGYFEALLQAQTAGASWHAFWDWAAQHPSLCLLEYRDAGEAYNHGGCLDISAVNSVVQLLRRRSDLDIRGLPHCPEGYIPELLSNW
ncbi:mitochondrial uncoupling 3 [Chlorella sorokiniana]|uniref:Mitochondrial uncoupling 3 n=1 Tax=Chlorella sorokiniana TaxID=3076 RepID=A0A2P6TRW9_CHLSO|nr:mitochondrial uncoupling 3 [Chlorella sorokiniana]|eukprot:PRW56809.1 mitochondrial uncoupling 3 [Chlorella sorokiniana]